MLNDYAMIVSEETVHTLSEGRLDGRVAVAVVSAGVAEVHVLPLADVGSVVRELPTIPARPGQDAFLIGIEEELEILLAVEEHVRNEAVRRGFGPPPGFTIIEAVRRHGLKVMVGEDGIDLRVSGKLARNAGWRSGDHVGIAVASDGHTACVFLGEGGRQLVPAPADSDALEVSSYLPVPHAFADSASTDWSECVYWVAGGRIYFDIRQFDVAEPIVEREEIQGAAVHVSEAAPAHKAARVLDGEFFIGAAWAACVVALAGLAGRLLAGW